MTRPHSVILHVDMDAFYASVEERERPELAGQPIVVGGTPEGRGVVAAASYEARRFGVHSAMPAAQARRLCPHAVFLPSRLGFYAEVSRELRRIFFRYTPQVEPLSLDEAYLDVGGSERLFGPPVAVARRIKDDVRTELRLVASVGGGPNKLIAKLASDIDKPDGLMVIEPGRVADFLVPLPVGRLWGVGRVAERNLARLGIRTVGDLRAYRTEDLCEHFGEWGRHLAALAAGRDEREVIPDQAARSLSHETTFAADIDDRRTQRACLLALTEQVGRRLRRVGQFARTVEIKVRYADFHTVTRSRTLPESTHRTRELWAIAAQLLAEQLARRADPVRLLGMGVSGLCDRREGAQADLFAAPVERRDERIDATVDAVGERFGASALRRGAPPPGASR